MNQTSQPLLLSLPDTAATRHLGVFLGRSLPAGSVMLLEGDLGSGKTTLVQGIGAGLGITDAIASPTFTLLNEYLEGRIPLYHFDLYRLDPVEVDGLHPELYWDGVEVDPGLVAIEWAERLTYLPPQYLIIRLRQTDDARTVEIGWQGKPLLDLGSLDLGSLDLAV